MAPANKRVRVIKTITWSNLLFAPLVLKGGSVLKTGILGNFVFAAFFKEYKVFNCRWVSVLNSFQLLSTRNESEVLLPTCYQNLEYVPCRCLGVFYIDCIWLVRRLIWHQCINESNYFMYQCTATDSTYPTHSSSLANYCISM